MTFILINIEVSIIDNNEWKLIDEAIYRYVDMTNDCFRCRIVISVFHTGITDYAALPVRILLWKIQISSDTIISGGRETLSWCG